MKRMSADDRLRARVEKELAWDFLLDEAQIEVEVVGGVVTLVGTVASRAEKLVAQRAAELVDGVHDLVNAIDVKPPEDMRPTDDELQTIVEQVLAWDALVPERNLQVSVADGLVALTGTCATRIQAQEAERAVSYLGGVRDVLNRIEVGAAGVSTDKVRTAIEEALARRAAHQAAQIDVVVDGGTVTLRGMVGSSMERRAVLGAVGHAPGIGEVRDELLVGEREPPPPSG